MEKTHGKSADDPALARVPAFGHRPPPRCHATVEDAPARLCGELATVRRHGNTWFDDAFFCDQHRGETDVAIAGAFVLRRVRIEGWVLLAGTHQSAPVCHAEAVTRLEAVVRAAGGVLDITRVTSSIGRYPDQADAGDARRSVGKGE